MLILLTVLNRFLNAILQLNSDLVVPDDDDEGKDEYDAKDTVATDKDGENRWNEKMKDKLERMKRKKVRDMSITVTQKGGTGSTSSRQRRTMMSVDDRIRMSGQGRIREELKQKQGEIDFRTGDNDGKVDICVQALTATLAKPSRFSLNITIQQTEDELDKEKEKMDEAASNSGGTAGGGDTLEVNAVQREMSRLERDMQTLNNRIQTILSNADYNKDQEVSFHEQSVGMNRAATYWPMIQLAVLIFTGFTQANHIVKFMRSRHIGY